MSDQSQPNSPWRLAKVGAHMVGWLLRHLQDAVPSQCAVCDLLQTHVICTACRSRFAATTQRCTTCAIDLPTGAPAHITQCSHCLQSPPPLDACVAAVDFAYPWSGLIAQFKFAAQPSLALALSTLMRDAHGATALIAIADVILPMPLTPARLQQRGFNQAWELARRLSPQTLAAKAYAHTLLRVRETPSQRGLTRQQRHHNVKGAFMVAPQFATHLRGQHVLLVDDVMTTGASIFEAGQTLRQAGAAHVSALALARTPLADH